ncbi:MAG TPA: hypothetical protein VMM18_10585 [Gemmatimonadaceae bacterium]|nr:hypothetical protein [Gemmatimonadaceae bacterium]
MHQLHTAAPLARACCLALVVASLGCGRDQTDARTDAAPGASASAVRVTDVELGRSVGADRRISDATVDFRPGDTIYASVVTDGSAQNATLLARWTFEDGQVVDETTRTIAPSGTTVTEFHISRPSGWPSGRYTLRVLLDGTEVESKEFEVRAPAAN